MTWKEQLQQAFEISERRKGHKKRRVTPFDVLALTPGDTVFFVPKETTNDRYGQRAKVIRPARKDVQNPTVRLEFSDGMQRSVQARLVRRDAPKAVEPAYLQEARKLPSWSRLVNELRIVADSEGVEFTPPQTAEQRARQMAGMLKASIPEQERPAAVRVLLDAARMDAQAQEARQAQRGGRGPVKHEKPREATSTSDPARLDQEQRAMINLIARSIHRRYFLSDRQIEARLTPLEREQAKVHGVLRQIIGLGQKEVGSADVKEHSGGKGSELHGLLQDSLTAAYQKALEACQQLHAGNVQNAVTLAAQVQEHRATYLVADAELERHRRKLHTGRYFHGDILSVRVEHVEHDDEGNFQAYLGMTQYYARVVFIYAEDGITLTVANAAELEALTGVRVGAQGWASLCRWVEDMSERAGGRKQGRRQDNDSHLIYQNRDTYLELRPSLTSFPDMPKALDCIRRALLVDLHLKDIQETEIPSTSPPAGFHEALVTNGRR